MTGRGNRKRESSNESNWLPSWRRKFTDGQTNDLEELFIRQKYITGKERTEIAQRLGLTTKQVKTWFQNRRTKWKREKQRNAYPEECFQQDGMYALKENFNRTIKSYGHCCEIPQFISGNSLGCIGLNGSFSAPVIVNDERRL